MTLVTFEQDVFPHVRGDVKDLDSAELKRVSEMAKLRNLETPYTKGAKTVEGREPVDGENGARENRAVVDKAATRENMVDQAAILEAQRNAVGEPASVDALGLIAENPVSVTGTEPVEGVEVENPQQAVDIGDPQGVEVKGEPKAKGKK